MENLNKTNYLPAGFFGDNTHEGYINNICSADIERNTNLQQNTDTGQLYVKFQNKIYDYDDFMDVVFDEVSLKIPDSSDYLESNNRHKDLELPVRADGKSLILKSTGAGDKLRKSALRYFYELHGLSSYVADIENDSETNNLLDFKIKPFSEVLNFKPIPCIVEEYIEKGSLTLLVGEPGVGKSHIAIELCASVATGSKFLGMNTKRCRVLYAPGEGALGVINRFKTWQATHIRSDVVGYRLEDNLFFTDSAIQLKNMDEEKWKAFEKLIKSLEVEMVVIDTWSRSTAGVEENSAGETAEIIAALDRVQKKTGVTFLVVHHSSKGGAASRGSSALPGAADTILSVKHWDTGKLADTNKKLKEDSSLKNKKFVPVKLPGKPIILSIEKMKNFDDQKVPLKLCITSTTSLGPKFPIKPGYENVQGVVLTNFKGEYSYMHEDKTSYSISFKVFDKKDISVLTYIENYIEKTLSRNKFSNKNNSSFDDANINNIDTLVRNYVIFLENKGFMTENIELKDIRELFDKVIESMVANNQIVIENDSLYLPQSEILSRVSQ